MESLACIIRQYKEIYIVHNSVERELVSFADGILFISKPHAAIPQLVQKMNAFSKIAGYCINCSKLELMPN